MAAPELRSGAGFFAHPAAMCSKCTNAGRPARRQVSACAHVDTLKLQTPEPRPGLPAHTALLPPMVNAVQHLLCPPWRCCHTHPPASHLRTRAHAHTQVDSLFLVSAKWLSLEPLRKMHATNLETYQAATSKYFALIASTTDWAAAKLSPDKSVQYAKELLQAALAKAEQAADPDAAVEAAHQAWTKFAAVPAGEARPGRCGSRLGGQRRGGGHQLQPPPTSPGTELCIQIPYKHMKKALLHCKRLCPAGQPICCSTAVPCPSASTFPAPSRSCVRPEHDGAADPQGLRDVCGAARRRRGGLQQV